MQIQSATDLNYFEGAVMRTGKSIEKEFIQGFDFFVEKKDNSAKKQEIEILETQIASQRSEYNNEVGRISRELRSVEDELRTGNNYARMSDYQKGTWQRESKNLESKIKTIEREINRKPSLNLQDDLMHLDGLKRALKSDKIRVSENFMVWEW
jgi:predicted  nucleic acid-binding Zn-ribbon protein